MEREKLTQLEKADVFYKVDLMVNTTTLATGDPFMYSFNLANEFAGFRGYCMVEVVDAYMYNYTDNTSYNANTRRNAFISFKLSSSQPFGQLTTYSGNQPGSDLCTLYVSDFNNIGGIRGVYYLESGRPYTSSILNISSDILEVRLLDVEGRQLNKLKALPPTFWTGAAPNPPTTVGGVDMLGFGLTLKFYPLYVK